MANILADLRSLMSSHSPPLDALVVPSEDYHQIHWYDSICKNCDVNITPQDGRFQCSKCQRHYILPPRRFRVAVLCSDSTGGIPTILGDLEVRRLTGKTVFDVELDMVEGLEQVNFPPILKSFVNKHYEITLKISKENVTQKSDVYEACDIAIVTDECLASNTVQTEQSFEAEDDANLTGTELGNTLEKPYPQDTEMRTVRTRVRKTPEKYRDNADNLTKKTPNVPKTGLMKSKTPSSEKSTTAKEMTRIRDTEEESPDEHISLTQYRKKQGKQSKK